MTGMRMKTLMSLAAFFICGLPTSSSLVAYDCSSNSTAYVELTTSIEDFLPPCKTLKDLETIRAAVIELTETPSTLVYLCKVTFTQQLIDNSIDKQNITIVSPETISKEDCFKAHRTKTLDIAGQHIKSLDPNGTVNYTLNADRTSYVTDNEISPEIERNYSAVRYYTVTLSKYNATVDISKNLIYLHNGVLCDFNSYSCQDNANQLFWKTLEHADSLLYWGNVSFTISDRSLANPGVRYAVIGTIDRIFVIKTFYNNFTIFDDRPAFPTELLNVYIVASEQEYPVRDRVHKIVHRGEFSKGIYSEPFYRGADTVDVSKRRCDREKQDLSDILTSLPVNSTLPIPEIRTIAKKDENGFFQLSSCERKEVTSRQTEQCFREIPVKDEDGRDWFLNPVSRFLSDESKSIACEPRHNISAVITPCKKPSHWQQLPNSWAPPVPPPNFYVPRPPITSFGPQPQLIPQMPLASMLLQIPLAYLVPAQQPPTHPSPFRPTSFFEAGVRLQSPKPGSQNQRAPMVPPQPSFLPPQPSFLPPQPSFLPPQPSFLPPRLASFVSSFSPVALLQAGLRLQTPISLPVPKNPEAAMVPS